MKTVPSVGSAPPAAICDFANANPGVRSIPITSPVERISGPKTGSASGKRLNGNTASLTEIWSPFTGSWIKPSSRNFLREVFIITRLAIFARGQEIAASRGLVLVDTKFEFGLAEDGTCILIDEVLTPDSSRYWLAHSYEARHAAGQEPENIDKEFLRLWYRERCDPYKDEVIPAAPDELVCELSRRYILLYELITGETFDFQAASAAVDRPAVLAECLAGL